MSDKPLPPRSGRGAARREPGSEYCGIRDHSARWQLLSALACTRSWQRATAPASRHSPVSNGMPTLTTKPVRWANVFHLLAVDISGNMAVAGYARAATVRRAWL